LGTPYKTRGYQLVTPFLFPYVPFLFPIEKETPINTIVKMGIFGSTFLLPKERKSLLNQIAENRLTFTSLAGSTKPLSVRFHYRTIGVFIE
jgi:hypothetical protein